MRRTNAKSFRRTGAGTRRRLAKGKRPAPASFTTSKGLKRINANRKKVGLPQLESKAALKFQQQQFSAKSATVWSHEENLSTVAEGTTEATREGVKVYFPPQKIKLIFEQPTNECYDYRILLIKNFEKATASLKPDDILTDWNYWTYGGYKKFSDRDAGKEKWKVFKDINFNWSTKDGSAERKEIFLKLPACNVEYDQDVAAGTANTNSLHLFILTNATSTSANHVVKYYFNYKFIDS